MTKPILLPAIALLVLTACSEQPAPIAPAANTATPPLRTISIRAQVPEHTDGVVYLSGNLPALGPWKADGLAMTGTGRDREARLQIAEGQVFEYKFTLGSWPREAVDANDRVLPNQRLIVAGDQQIDIQLAGFKRDPAEYMADPAGSGVKGSLVYWPDVASRHLAYARNVSIWLPPGYAQHPEQRYRVLYMSDGQNLFDPRIANTGTDWGVDEAMLSLSESGEIEPAIVVAAWSSPARGPEYSPWHDAPNYARFLIEELMPRINAEFRTLTGPANTFHMGSSMGGLLSFYLVTRHPQQFGGCGCLSSHFPLSEAVVADNFPGYTAAATPDPTPYVLHDIAAGLQLPAGARMWFDYGSQGLDADYAPTHAAVRDWLLAEGAIEGRDFVVRNYPGADHNETAWRARLKDSLRFLLGKPTAAHP